MRVFLSPESGLVTWISKPPVPPAKLLENASRAPSGEYAGWISSDDPTVTALCPVPSTFTVYSLKEPFEGFELNTTLPLSCDQVGALSSLDAVVRRPGVGDG